jgi:hypothetical protein
MPYEDRDALDEFSQRLREAMNPSGDLESLLVDRIIALGWRLERLGHIEAGILEYWIRRAAEDTPAPGITITLTLGRAFVRDSVKGNSLSNLSRYESRMERSLFRSLHELQRLQADRNGQDVPPPQVVDIDVTGVPELPGSGDERD